MIKFTSSTAVLLLCSLVPFTASAHESHNHVANNATPVYNKNAKPPILLAQADTKKMAAVSMLAVTPAQLNSLPEAIFITFAPGVGVWHDEKYFYVSSNSVPNHRMMVGITAWQQQVPLPQPYSGTNAWRIPLYPILAANPKSAKDNFFRGAIALAANGVPIYNPIKNDGKTDTFLAGELDEFGGHSGRADDYHYHIAPTHLQAAVGAGMPIAYALDGYAIYGFTDQDGSNPGNLDKFNGHNTPSLGYHYHATKTYPYLNGGFHGEVVEAGGQVDPQPQPGGVRPALTPWRGASIVGFKSKDAREYSVEVSAAGQKYFVNYVLNYDGTVRFDFVAPDGSIRTETYSPRLRGGGKGGEQNKKLPSKD